MKKSLKKLTGIVMIGVLALGKSIPPTSEPVPNIIPNPTNQ